MTEANETAVRDELVKPFTSFCGVEPDGVKDRYNWLNESANEKGTLIENGTCDLSKAWAEFLPVLDEIQSLLSQRGSAREMLRDANLPLWSEWLEAFQKKSGLNCTVRTLYNHLSRYRAIGKEKRKRAEPPVRLPAKDQKRVLTALQFANEMVDALDHGGNYLEPLEGYRRVAIEPDRIAQLLEIIPPDEVSFGSPGTLPLTAIPPVVAPGLSPTFPATIQPSVLMPSVGDWGRLVEMVNASCGSQIDATLDGLRPEMAAYALGKFVGELAKLHYRYDPAAGEIAVTVSYIERRTPAVKEAA